MGWAVLTMGQQCTVGVLTQWAFAQGGGNSRPVDLARLGLETRYGAGLGAALGLVGRAKQRQGDRVNAEGQRAVDRGRLLFLQR